MLIACIACRGVYMHVTNAVHTKIQWCSFLYIVMFLKLRN